MKNYLKFKNLITIILSEKVEKGLDTSWEDGDIKVTIKDIIKYLDTNNIHDQKVPIKNLEKILIKQDYDGIAKKRVQSADLSYPIIVTKLKGKYKSILDGNHRLYKAILKNDKFIQARILNLDNNSVPDEFVKLFK